MGKSDQQSDASSPTTSSPVIVPTSQTLGQSARLSHSASAGGGRLSRMSGGTPAFQRQKCSCGGEAGESGMCADCKAKVDNQQHALQRRIQRKMSVNEPGDAQEQEADSTARSVIGRQATPGIQRQSAEENVLDVHPDTQVKIEGAREPK